MRLYMRRVSRAAPAMFAAAVLLLLWPAVSRAQSSPSRRDERRAEMETRQRELRSLSDVASRPAKKSPDRRPSYQQVAEDFEQLQLRNYQLSGAAEPGAQLDYRLIVEEAAEVRRRASRLKSNLALPAVKNEQRPKKGEEPPTPEGVRAAIASLDGLVKSFVWNPVFRSPGVLDAENSSKAGRELEEILRLSEQIREAAKALAKTAAKSP